MSESFKDLANAKSYFDFHQKVTRWVSTIFHAPKMLFLIIDQGKFWKFNPDERFFFL